MHNLLQRSHQPQMTNDRGTHKANSNRTAILRRSRRASSTAPAQSAVSRQSTVSVSSADPTAPAATVPNADQQTNDDYRLLLSPMFAAMTKITDNLFLTGVGGMTRENFNRNHIDFVVNITTDAPFWEDVESLRIALEDDSTTNMLPYLDFAVDKIHEAITRRRAHVLVHCVAGVSRSASVVIAYLIKYRRMNLRGAFNYCYNLRPVIRPNNGFMSQLMNYELQISGQSSARMIQANIDGTIITVPNFFIEEHPRLVWLEVLRAREQQRHIEQQRPLQVPSVAPGTPRHHGP